MADEHSELPRQGALLGIDPGEVRVGLATCDARQVVARPLVIAPRKWSRLVAQLETLLQENEIVGMVVGHPVRESGALGHQSQQAETLAFLLRREWPELPVVLWDERWSSEEAEARLGVVPGTSHEGGLDAAAAAVILQAFLDSRGE
jgi:putative Holliday junction resolvase